MAEADIPKTGQPIDELLPIGVVQDRAFALHPDKRILLIHRVKQRMDQMGIVGCLDLLDIDRVSRHEFSNSKPKKLPQLGGLRGGLLPTDALARQMREIRRRITWITQIRINYGTFYVSKSGRNRSGNDVRCFSLAFGNANRAAIWLKVTQKGRVEPGADIDVFPCINVVLSGR